MIFNKSRIFKRPILLLGIVVIIGLLSFYTPFMKTLIKKAEHTIIIQVQLHKLRLINNKMRHNQRIAQGLLLSKTWEDKFAMHKDKKVIYYIGPRNINTQLFWEARDISQKYHIGVEAHYVLLPYLYKEKGQMIVLGLIGLDCGDIKIMP